MNGFARIITGAVALAAMALLPAGAQAGCGQLATCNSGNLCMYSGDGLTGTPIENVAGDNPTLNFTGCGSPTCICWNDLTQSAKNNATSTSTHFRLYSGLSYTGSTLCLNKGDTVSGSAGMGALYQQVRAEKKTTSCP